MARLESITGKAISGEWGFDDEDGTGIPVLRTTNFTNDGIIDFSNVVTRTVTKKDLSLKYLRPGDIIIEKSGGSDKQPVGRVVYYSGDENTYLFNNFTGVLRVIDSTCWDSKYLFYALYANYLKGGTRKYQNKTTGLHNLKTDQYVSEFEVQDCSLQKQQQIVIVLDKVCALISLRKQQLAKLDELVKARFVEMFGRGAYPYQNLIDLIVEGAGLSYGIVQPGDNGTGDMGVLRPVDLIDGTIAEDSIKYINRSIGDSFKKTELNGNELLITVRGTTGITALSDSRFVGMNVTRGIAVIRYDDTKINPVYLNEYFKTDESQNYIQEHTRGATLQQINLSDLRVQQILVPPREMQDRFSVFVATIGKSKLTIQRSLDKLEMLKKALMQEYFGQSILAPFFNHFRPFSRTVLCYNRFRTEKGGSVMYFNERMFNPQYVNPSYYNQIQAEIAQYQIQQNVEVTKMVKAMRDMCEAVKKMDEQHQQEAFIACLGVMAQEFGW